MEAILPPAKMEPATVKAGEGPLATRAVLVWAGTAVAAFHVAFLAPVLSPVMVVFFYALVQVSFARTRRIAFYTALVVGIACYAPHLTFFWGIFGGVAISFWTILAIWIAFFVLLARQLRRAVPRIAWIILLPVLWTGFEYFRCEWNPLRFTWLTPGFASGPGWLVHIFGVYGAGTVLMAGAAAAVYMQARRERWAAFAVLWCVCLGLFLWNPSYAQARILGGPRAAQGPLFVGVQLEDPSLPQVLDALDSAVSVHPDADLIVLGEYSLYTPPPSQVLDWAQAHKRYVVLGGMQPVSGWPVNGNRFGDTAYVIDPAGQVVFSQGKCVPVQFFHDGQPAKEQRVWDSPWGKIGICICYDLSYRRVTDALIRQGAQMLIVPSMDAQQWGDQEHELAAMVAPVRAAEYGIPIFRVCTSGISPVVLARGAVIATAPFPGQGSIIAEHIEFTAQGAARIPRDQYFAPAAAVVTAGVVLGLLIRSWVRGFLGWRRKSSAPV